MKEPEKKEKRKLTQVWIISAALMKCSTSMKIYYLALQFVKNVFRIAKVKEAFLLLVL